MPKLYNILLLPLLPLLLWQARKLKRTIIKLPEASGDRVGEQGVGPALKLLIVGDSAAAGVGCQLQDDALAGQLALNLSQEFSLNWQLIAKSGVNITQCIAHLSTLANAKSNRFDVALISIGVNDVTGRTNSSLWRSQLLILTELLQDKFGVGHIVWTNVPPMEQFRVLAHPMRWFLGQKSKHFNQILSDVVSSNDCCSLLTLADELNEQDMAIDGFHPGPNIYKQWASLAHATITQQYGEHP